MVGILYFSSTGNSLQIAEQVRKRIEGKIVYIPKYYGNGSEFEKIILVTPIYSFGLPTFVYDLLPRLDKNLDIIAIQNYGGMVGGADRMLFDYATKLGLKIIAIYTMKMPENYTLSFVPPKLYVKSILKKSHKHIEQIIDKIESKRYELPKKGKSNINTYLKNKSNWHIIGERFWVNSNCIKCQKCVQICPSNNISITDGEIKFGSNCVACLGCYHRCPQKAIVYLNKRNKYRYVNPNIKENEIGKDIE